MIIPPALRGAAMLAAALATAACDVGQVSDGGAGGNGGGGSNNTGTGNTGTGNTGTGDTGGTSGTGTPSNTTSGGTTTGSDTGLPPIMNGCNGYATRFWDCCKPHCGWKGNVPGGMNPMNTCNQSDQSLGGNYDAASSCNGGDAYTCHGLTPWAVNSLVSYGYAATSSGDICGRCYQIQFTGTSHNGGDDPGSASLAGKAMIVQAINVGYDVGGGQFDLLIPGGGVGAFNACSKQWGVDTSQLGKQYGGFLGTCKDQLGYDKPQSVYQSCVAERCKSVFADKGLTELAAGCEWFVDWLGAADNPNIVYKEVQCPQEIIDKTGMNRTPLNDIKNSCP
jgi:hypothetical protein